MSVFVLVCGNVFDGISDSLVGSAEISSREIGLRGSNGRWGDRPTLR